jgi:hypothetical protein
MGIIYLIHVREFLNKGENVFKVGRTKNLTQRLSHYPKGSKLIFCMDAVNCTRAEKEILGILAEEHLLRRDLGREYIEGDLEHIIESMHMYIKNHNNSYKNVVTKLQATPMQYNPIELITTFIDELHRDSDLSCKLIQSREFHNQFNQWLDDKCYDVNIKHASFLNILYKVYGVKGLVATVNSRSALCVQFPSSMVSSR